MMLMQPRFCFLLLIIILGISKLYAQFELSSNDRFAYLLKHQYTTLSENRIEAAFERMTRYLPGQPVFDSLQNVLITDAEINKYCIILLPKRIG